MTKRTEEQLAMPSGETEASALALATPVDQITALLQRALDRNVPVEAMEKLVSLHERVSDRQARAEFFEARAKFQAECPPIPRSASVDYVTKNGGVVKYSYADLDAIVRVVKPILHRHGFAYTWDFEEQAGKLICQFRLTHIGGHSEVSKYTNPISQSEKMSPSQNVGSCATVARRQSMVSGLGLTDTDDDPDGADVCETITDKQEADLVSLIQEVGADGGKFLAWLKVAKLADLPASRYAGAVQALEAKRRGR